MTGNEFRALRDKTDLSQRDIANELGIENWQTVQKWELKKDEEITAIKAIYWPKLGQLLSVPADEFAPKHTIENIAASGNSVVVKGGRDASYSEYSSTEDIRLTPLERQVIMLNREVGNTKMLRGFLSRLLEMQAIAEKLY